MYSKSFYKKSPIFVQNFLISTKHKIENVFRKFPYYNKIYTELLSLQWCEKSIINHYVDSELKKILISARKSKLYAEKIDFTSFEYINKSTARGFLENNRNRNLFYFTGSTSGTTGSPLVMKQNIFSVNRESAFVDRFISWTGYKNGERCAWIRGDMICNADNDVPPFWRFSKTKNMMLFSSYHLSQNNIKLYVNELIKFDPILIQAYPSSIYLIAKYMNLNNIKYEGPSLKAIVTSSESWSDDFHEEVTRAFGCKLFDWYGQFERVAAIGSCEYGKLHVIEDYSLVEFLPTHDDNIFEIIGTGLNNSLTPLVKYRTGDFVEYHPTDRCRCGRDFRVVRKVLGRADDYIRTNDGRLVGRIDHIFKGVSGILEAQIVQNIISGIDVYIVPASNFDVNVINSIKINAHLRVGSDMIVNVFVVESIKREKSGKFKSVVCNVKF